MPQNIRARSGAGASLEVGNGASPEVFTRVAQVFGALKWSGTEITTADTTNQDSSADLNNLIWEEMIPTIVKGGTVDFSVNLVPEDASQRIFFGYFDGKPHNFNLKSKLDPKSSPQVPYMTLGFSGYLFKRPTLEFDIKKQMMMEVSIQVVGSPETIVYSS